MVIITFDDAVNSENWDLYNNKLFIPERYFKLESFRKKKQTKKLVGNLCMFAFYFHSKNPNGCPIHATFYISHEYNNYQYVQKLWNAGHEIAAHSIT